MAGFRPFTRRKRRADDGRYMPRDAKLWRALIKAARYQARAPQAKSDPLLKAADACGRAVLPPLPLGTAPRTSCFVRLMALGRMFWRLSVDERERQARDLLKLVAECDVILTAPAPEPPGQTRRDIFG